MSITIWQRTNSNIITQALVSGKKNIPRVFFFYQKQVPVQYNDNKYRDNCQ